MPRWDEVGVWGTGGLYLGNARILRELVMAIRPCAPQATIWQYLSEARKSSAFVHDFELETQKGNTCEI